MQEMASRGLSAVYQLGDEAGRNELLNSLIGTLQGDLLKPLNFTLINACDAHCYGLDLLLKG